jgi:WD40 repeat protein
MLEYSTNSVLVADAETGKKIRDVVKPVPYSRRLIGALSSDHRHGICLVNFNTMFLCETQKWEDLHEFRGHTDKINVLALAPNGRFFLSASQQDRTVRLWNVPESIRITPMFRDSLRQPSGLTAPKP